MNKNQKKIQGKPHIENMDEFIQNRLLLIFS